MQRPPDGIFVGNNLMAVGALEALAALNLAVPTDVRMVSFDEIPWAALIRPSLTTVAQPAYQIGVEAARLLLRRIRNPEAAIRQLVLQPELRIRESA